VTGVCHCGSDELFLLQCLIKKPENVTKSCCLTGRSRSSIIYDALENVTQWHLGAQALLAFRTI